MSLPRVSLSVAGLDSNAVLKLVEKLGEADCHSFMIVRHQHVVAEGWWAPYNKNYRHTIYSLTKSFTSMAIGFAVEEGLLSIQDPVIKFFPKVLPCKPCEYMTKMTVRDLLTMSTGHTTEPVSWRGIARSREERHADEDHVYHFLASYVDKEPGSIFLYNTPATFMCGAILQTLTGQNVFEYLKPRLLDPLGITNYHYEVNTKGFGPAGFGAHLCTEDIAKFGLFLLNRGIWNGKQLLPASWIDEATGRQVDNSNHPSGATEWQSGYGYQFWRCSLPHAYRGDGAFGQFCVVMPEQDVVVAITSGTRRMDSVLDALWSILLPALSKEDAQPDPALLAQLTQLQIPPPTGQLHTEASLYSGRIYRLAPNFLRLSKISVVDMLQEATVTFWRGEQTCTARVGYGKWIETTTGHDDDGIADIFSEVACAGAWRGDTFSLKVIYTRTPFSDTFSIHFDDKGIMIDYMRDPSNDGILTAQFMGREI